MTSPWELTSEALGQPWRLWTGHLAHWSLGHAVVNAVACAVPVAVVDRRLRPRLVLILLAVLPLLSLVLLPGLGGATYRGASGAACVLWAAAGGLACRERDWPLGGTLMALLALKLVLESSLGFGVIGPGAGWRSLPAAHRWGALLGAVASLGPAGGRLRFRRPSTAP